MDRDTADSDMNCKQAQQRWNDRLDTGVHDAELDRHLVACHECRKYAEQMQRVVGALDELRIDTDRLADSKRATIGNGADVAKPTPPSHPALRLGVRLSRVAALIGLALVGIWYVGQRFGNGLDDLADVKQEPVVQRAPGQPQTEPALDLTPKIRLRGDTAENYIAVVAGSTEPDVQMIWLYPVLADKSDSGPS